MSFLDDVIDPDKAKRWIDQGTAEWDAVRVGRFTASEMHRLMVHGFRKLTVDELAKRPKKGKGSAIKQTPDPGSLGEAAMSYITEKVAEVMTGQCKQQGYAFPIVWGKTEESNAKDFFIEKTGFIHEPVGFFPYTDHAGGSPDGFINDDDILECKCPYDSAIQLGYLMLTDHYDVARDHPDIYCQCQSNLLFTGRKNCHLVTYDPRMVEDKHKMQHIVIPANEQYQDLIIKKIELAVKEKLELLKLYR